MIENGPILIPRAIRAEKNWAYNRHSNGMDMSEPQAIPEGIVRVSLRTNHHEQAVKTPADGVTKPFSIAEMLQHQEEMTDKWYNSRFGVDEREI